MSANYNAWTCVTAGELREAGIPIDEKIPDCAWIPRASMELKVGEPTFGADRSLSCELSISFGEPFHWVSVDVTIPGAVQ